MMLLIFPTTLAQSHLLAFGVNIVVNFNRHVKVDNEVVKLLHDAYTMLFHDVIFTGQLRPNRLPDAIKWSECDFPWQANYLCFGKAMIEYPPPIRGGTLFVGDDTVIDPYYVAKLCLTRFWFPTPRLVNFSTEEYWQWWGFHAPESKWNVSDGTAMAMLHLPEPFREMAFKKMRGFLDDSNATLLKIPYPTTTDMVYCPKFFTADWIHLGHYFWRYGVMTEVATPIIIAILGGTTDMDVEDIPIFNTVHSPDTCNVTELLVNNVGLVLPENCSSLYIGMSPYEENRVAFAHSLKLSSGENRQIFKKWWRSVCP